MEKGGENRDTYSDENASQVPDFMMNRCELFILLSNLTFLQYILIFEGEHAPKKNAIFWSEFSKKCLKTPFSDCFFSKFCLRRRKFGQNRDSTVLRESSKNQFGRPKKKGRQNFRKFFENPPPSLEKILDPPLCETIVVQHKIRIYSVIKKSF